MNIRCILNVFIATILTVSLVGMTTYAYAQSTDTKINIRYGKHLDSDRIVLDFPKRFSSNVFSLSSPDRMVIDLPRENWKIDVSDTVKKSPIKNIRIGDFEQSISRIVIDMDMATQIDKDFWLPASGHLKDRLVIDFKKGAPTKAKNVSINDVLKKTIGASEPSTYLTPQRKPTKNKPVSRSVRKPMIVIDAGHGGKDSGAIAKSGLYEKTVVLKLAKDLAKALKATGRYNVKLTRENDRYIALRKRVEFARKHKADLFLSIHADSIENRKVSGASVYTLSEKASDAQTAKLAARENKSDMIAGLDFSEQDQEVTNILLDLVTRETTNQSKFFANTVVTELQNGRVKTLQRPHRHAGFAVLKAPDVPAILIESGFMSNAKEASLLNDPRHRQNIVTSLRKGVDAYFERLTALNSTYE